MEGELRHEGRRLKYDEYTGGLYTPRAQGRGERERDTVT